MDYYIKNTLFLLVLLLPVVLGIMRYRSLDSGGKILLAMAVVLFLSEGAAYFMAVKYRNNLIVYNISSLLHIFLISLYFDNSIPSFRRRHIGIIVGVCSVIVGVINNFFIQPPNVIVSYFLSYQSVVIIAMAMICLASIIPRHEDYPKVGAIPHFWVSLVLMIYWSATYMLWALMDYFFVELNTWSQSILLSLFLLNCLANIAFSFIFFYYPKMKANV